MGSLSNFAELELLDHVFNAAYSPPAAVYLALCTADPTDAGTGASMNEVANSGSYARTAITFGAASARRITQNALVTFPQASGSWGTVTHWAIVDSATYGAGNMLAYGALSPSKSIVNANTPSVPTSTIYVEYSAGVVSTYLAHKLLDLMFRNTAYSKPATYVALTTSTVADADTGSTIVEPSGNAYARKLVNINGGASPTWDLAASGSVDNTHAIDFVAASGAWGTIVATALVDALTTGNLLIYDNGTADQAVDNGDTVSYAAGAFVITMS